MAAMIESATWQLPPGHDHVAAFATEAEAAANARARVGDGRYYYLTDKRGSWEVIAYDRGCCARG